MNKLVNLDLKTLTDRFNTRLGLAKMHLVLQIRDLIKENRLNRLGLITFNE